jgi:2,3-bisphosphoglycerate-independent phosphoglycerate mutase
MRRPVVLVILDGWGVAEDTTASAIDSADIPNFRRLWKERPKSLLRADGEAVGLMPGQMGDSNVGHLNLGGGRIVYQDLPRIFKSIEDGSFFENEALLTATDRARQSGGALHLMGLLSDGGVHSHERHVEALLDLAKRCGVRHVYVHCFLDGRDVPPSSALQYIDTLGDAFVRTGLGEAASVMGRYWAMDRDKRWDRVQKAYDALVLGQGLRAATARDAVREAYSRGETDEFVLPTVIAGRQEDAHTIQPGDSVIFFNFRADRAREITRAFIDRDLAELERPLGAFPVTFAGMAQYDATFHIPVAFPPQYLNNTFGEVVSKAGLRQLRLAETEKYAHVTFFFNGMVEPPFEGEDRILIPSPKIPTYDLKPEMSALEVAESAVDNIRSGKYDCIIMNFANPDMVGHTGNMEAAMIAAQTVDKHLGEVLSAVLGQGGAALIVSDHGNAEKMKDSSGALHTAHTSNPVPCILVDDQRKDVALRDGILADVAPTLVEIIGMEKPPEMDRTSLIVH